MFLIFDKEKLICNSFSKWPFSGAPLPKTTEENTK